MKLLKAFYSSVALVLLSELERVRANDDVFKSFEEIAAENGF